MSEHGAASSFVSWLKTTWGMLTAAVIVVGSLGSFGAWMYQLGEGSVLRDPAELPLASTSGGNAEGTDVGDAPDTSTPIVDDPVSEPESRPQPSESETVARDDEPGSDGLRSVFDTEANFEEYDAETVYIDGEEHLRGLDSYLLSCSRDNTDVWHFDLSKDYETFDVIAGVSDRSNTDARLIFRVLGDNEVLYENTISFGDPDTISLKDLSDVVRLTLQITNTRDLCGQSGDDDVGVFAEPRLGQ